MNADSQYRFRNEDKTDGGMMAYASLDRSGSNISTASPSEPKGQTKLGRYIEYAMHTGGAAELDFSDAAKLVRSDRLPDASSARQSIRLVFNTCIEALDQAADPEADVVGRSNAVSAYGDALSRLWNYSEDRGDDFAALINCLQCMHIDVPAEDVRAEEIKAIRRVIRRASDVSRFSGTDLAECTHMLAKAGCDVFRGLR